MKEYIPKKINYRKERNLSPEFFIGKLYWLGKALIYILILLITKPSRKSILLAQLILQVTPQYTMLSFSRLANLYNLVIQANKLGIEGDIIECGVWNGGSAAVMGCANNSVKNTVSEKREIWLFDSFAGLPKPSEHDDLIEKEKFAGLFKGSVENVKRIFKTLNLSLDNAHIVEGWFGETLRAASIKNIALLHIDADLYDSVKACLDNLYDKISSGGFLVCDDYVWAGSRQAINDFIKERKIKNVKLTIIDGSVYFQKR